MIHDVAKLDSELTGGTAGRGQARSLLTDSVQLYK